MIRKDNIIHSYTTAIEIQVHTFLDNNTNTRNACTRSKRSTDILIRQKCFLIGVFLEQDGLVTAFFKRNFDIPNFEFPGVDIAQTGLVRFLDELLEVAHSFERSMSMESFFVRLTVDNDKQGLDHA